MKKLLLAAVLCAALVLPRLFLWIFRLALPVPRCPECGARMESLSPALRRCPKCCRVVARDSRSLLPGYQLPTDEKSLRVRDPEEAISVGTVAVRVGSFLLCAIPIVWVGSFYFGSSFLDITLPDGNRLLYPPTGFSQVNESMVPAFLNTVEKLIRPEPDARLLDLYCGYGLIGLSLVPKVDSMIGIEIDGPSVKAAAASAEHLYRKKEIRFLRGEIGPALIRNRLPLPANRHNGRE